MLVGRFKLHAKPVRDSIDERKVAHNGACIVNAAIIETGATQRIDVGAADR